MKPATILLTLLLLCLPLMAQDKAPKSDVKISTAKVTERMQQVEKAIQDRQKELFDKDPQLQQLVGLYRGLALSIGDSTLAISDSTRKPIQKK